jgi:hypothetical protein
MNILDRPNNLADRCINSGSPEIIKLLALQPRYITDIMHGTTSDAHGGT